MKNVICFIVAWAIALRLFGQSVAPQIPPPPVADVESARLEAVKKHPKLADKNSLFSQVFSNEVERLKRENAQVFESITWPLLLAERLDRKLKSAPPLNAAELAALITIPDFDVRNVSTQDALKILATRSQELDPDKRGVAITLDHDTDVAANSLTKKFPPQITATLQNKSLFSGIKLIAGLSNLVVSVKPDAISVHSRSRKTQAQTEPEVVKLIPPQLPKPTDPPAEIQKVDNSEVSVSEDEIAQTLMFWGGEFHRWDKNPKISIHATPEIAAKFRDSLGAGIAQLNSILFGTPVQLEMLDGNMAAADICVYIDGIENLQRIWRKNGATPQKIDWEGRMEGQWETTGALKRIGIYIPIESLNVAPPLVQSRHLLIQMSHAVGIGSSPRGNVLNTSRILLENFVRSPRFAAASNYKEPNLIVFTNAEKRIIRFAYQFGPVQADKAALRVLARKKWTEVKLPAQ